MRKTMKAGRMIMYAASLLVLASCSTTRLVPEGQYRLAANRLEVEGDRKLGTSELGQYIRQQPNDYFLFGWNPFLCIYNWSDGSGEGINGFWEKIGTPPVVFNPLLVENSCENLKTHLNYLGYYDASVSGEVETRGRLATVTYKINTGERRRIDSLVFDIPEGEFAEEFYADTANVGVRVGDYLSEKSLEAETVRGAEYFRDLGYYRFNKNHYFFEADTLDGSTLLYYRIRPYSRSESPDSGAVLGKYRFGDVTISYPSDLPLRESTLTQYNIIRPGEYFSERVVNTTYNRFSALSLFNQVNIEIAPSDSATVDCDIQLDGMDMMGFKANIELSSNSSGLFGASPQLTFYHKNLLGGGEWLNVGFTGNWQVMPGTGAASTELGVSASLSLPHALGYPTRKIRGRNIPRTEFNISYNYQNRPEYKRTVANFSYGYTGQARSRFFYQIYPLRMSLVKLYEISDDFYGTLLQNPYLWGSFFDTVDLGIGGTVYYTTDASIVPKSSYQFVRLDLDLSGNVLSLFNTLMPYNDITKQHSLLGLPYSQYVRTELELAKVFRFGRNESQALAFRLNAGVGKAYGNSSALPFEKQFYCGGASSMRGWQARTLGPGHSSDLGYFIIPSQTGDMKLEFDMEYRFRLFWKFEGALFAETGNIWYLDSFKDSFPGSLAADWGAGLRLNLDFILLRLDAGFKFHDPSREAGSRWVGPSGWVQKGGYAVHFGVGYPF